MKSIFIERFHAPSLPRLLLLALAAACGADEDASLPVCDEVLCTVDDRDEDGDRILTTVVHAPDEDAPIFFSFASPGAALSAEEVEAGAWDLSFARTTIRVNGGASGDGGVEVAWIDGLGVDGADAPPSDGWVSDGADEDALAFAQADGWYRYDLLKHVVEPRERLYFVRARDGVVYAVELISYYDHAGESRHPTFDWIAVGDGR